ncbi:hypothetical protein TK90_1194 [Thioalkalivibrio sp. K90mix]|uniref:CsiV family protein n=1 Tax=unclassified Thioalkalivibrio TaxID=2621013 RepID=UPI000195A56D|nr:MULTISPECIES: CsiV family protein [unclassified Thioalkalivibrio]ADC71703.1 hypothetical protein TK90_1194 [Thioalkalivibrio sp. K90mix]
MPANTNRPDPNRRRLVSSLALLPLLGLGTTATAQVGRRYRIELVIFEHTTAESRRLQEEIASVREPNLAGSELGGRIYQDSRRGFELQRAASRVEDSGTGRVIARLAWDQLGRDHSATPWLKVQQGRRLGARQAVFGDSTTAAQPIVVDEDRYELEGRLRVWVGRFLHLETDLIYHIDRDGAEPLGVAVRGHQRMNSGSQLFYLDHPVVGIIARVTRLDS